MAMRMGPERAQDSAEREDRRADLMAMLAASRELGPEMDTSLVDSYMARRPDEEGREERARRQGIVAGPGGGQPRPFGWPLGLTLICALVTVGVIASVVTFAFGAPAGDQRGFFPFPWIFLWFLFPLFGWGWWGRRGYYRSRRRYSYDADDGRRVDVYERTRGYGPHDDYPPRAGRPYGASGPNRPSDPDTPPTVHNV